MRNDIFLVIITLGNIEYKMFTVRLYKLGIRLMDNDQLN